MHIDVFCFPCRCVIVMYDSRKNKQSHICNHCKKTITCLAFSPDGRLLVTGEVSHGPRSTVAKPLGWTNEWMVRGLVGSVTSVGQIYNYCTHCEVAN